MPRFEAGRCRSIPVVCPGMRLGGGSLVSLCPFRCCVPVAISQLSNRVPLVRSVSSSIRVALLVFGSCIPCHGLVDPDLRSWPNDVVLCQLRFRTVQLLLQLGGVLAACRFPRSGWCLTGCPLVGPVPFWRCAGAVPLCPGVLRSGAAVCPVVSWCCLKSCDLVR